MSDKTPLEAETTGDTATFKFFDREWVVPVRRHLSHIKAMRDAARLSWGGLDLMIAETFLSPAVSPANQQEPDQFAALLDIDPDEGELDEFTAELAKALGLGSLGNSKPSSASS